MQSSGENKQSHDMDLVKTQLPLFIGDSILRREIIVAIVSAQILCKHFEKNE